MEGFARVARIQEVTPGKLKGIKEKGKRVLLANVEGNYYAIGDVCTHAGCLLSDGKLEGHTVICTCHGSQFDVGTGHVLHPPASKPEPVYDVKIEGEDISIRPATLHMFGSKVSPGSSK